ncbi:TPA: CPBP family intramembrane metalloprotease [Candidatus Bathyarchaeota archaeon]|nr:CPBP family intramembrane metalloprotease [Candidatus Bathyarchaeota archaeon]
MLKLVETVISVPITVVVVTYFLSIPLGIALIFSSGEGLLVIAKEAQIFIILFAAEFKLPIRVNVGALFVAMMAVYSLCLFISWRTGAGFHKAVKKVLEGGAFKNWLASMPLFSSALLVAILLLQGLQESHGVPTGSIHFQNPYEALISLSYSPIIEEVGFRLSPLGLISAVYCALELKEIKATRGSTLTTLSLAFISPDKAKRSIGTMSIEENGWLKGIRVGEWVGLISSSLFFGLAHYLAKSGWEIGKITSASLAGFILGLVYFRYGIHASFLLHWFFNYYGHVYELAAKNYAQIFSKILLMIDWLTASLGIFAIILFLAGLFFNISRAKGRLGISKF